MCDPDSRLLPKFSMICWVTVFLLPLAAFIFLIASGYINAPPDQIPFLIKLLVPIRLTGFSLFACLGIVGTAKIFRRRKIQWAIFSLVAVFLQMVVLSVAMTFWFMAHIPKT